MQRDDLDILHEHFERVVCLAAELERTPRNYGTDELLSPSEIHLIERIGANDETLSVTDLAGLVGVTKGAVSQMIKRLAEKRLVRKDPDPRNSSRTIVGLTAKGKAAYYAHMDWHETMDGGFKAYFNNLSPEQIDFLVETLSRLETFFRRILG